MNEVATAEEIKKLTAPILEKGFSFEYFYEKGGDSSCVYICRFKKGKDYFDWREVSGADDVNIITCIKGEYGFPNLKMMYPKQHRRFRVRHLFRKATMDEKRAFVAGLLLTELSKDETQFLGLKF